ncbi:MAG: hypothetical protein ACK5RC_09590 [Curvibacter sp.]|jgi:hypothetical protein|nr:hypothetical protein [Curvibacter sp.]
MLRHAIFSPSAFFLCVCVLLAGCTSLLPKSANRTSTFESYEAAQAALLALEPNKKPASRP